MDSRLQGLLPVAETHRYAFPGRSHFFLLAAIGTLWSDASWAARLYAVGPAAKLLVLPGLFYHFEAIGAGNVGVRRFSGLLHVADDRVRGSSPSIPRSRLKPQGDAYRGIFVKKLHRPEPGIRAVRRGQLALSDRHAAAGETASGLAGIAHRCRAGLRLQTWRSFVVSRTALVTMPIMLAVFAALHLKWRSNVVPYCCAAVFACGKRRG